eukprot:42057-Prorocentrum_minimum.AAC.3
MTPDELYPDDAGADAPDGHGAAPGGADGADHGGLQGGHAGAHHRQGHAAVDGRAPRPAGEFTLLTDVFTLLTD